LVNRGSKAATIGHDWKKNVIRDDLSKRELNVLSNAMFFAICGRRRKSA